MAKLIAKPKLDLNVALELNEEEIKALEALVCYGTDPFLEVFYKNMGSAYLKPHEKGLRSLFESIKSNLPSIIERINTARTAFNKDE